jgi:hypothetical protein
MLLVASLVVVVMYGAAGALAFFPHPDYGLRIFDRIVWAVCAITGIAALAFGNNLTFGGAADDLPTTTHIAVVAIAGLPIAAGILLVRYATGRAGAARAWSGCPARP